MVRRNLRAKYDPQLDCWNFVLDSIEFKMDGYEFREEAFDWALEASRAIRKLSAELDREVEKNSSVLPDGVRCSRCKWKLSLILMLIFSAD